MKKVLVIRLSSIGDIVLTSPVIRCIKKQLPGVDLHYVVKEQFLPIIQANPYIDKIHVFKGNLDDLISELKTEKFDYIIDLHKNIRSMIIRLMLMVRAKSFPKINFQKWLYVKTRINLMPEQHIVERYFEAVRKLGVTNDNLGLDYFIPVEDEIDLDTLPGNYRNGNIAFVIGAKHNTKMLPEEKIIAVCKGINKPVILLGGPLDQLRGERIKAALGDQVYNACGKYTINQSASLIRQADKVITHDTGLMHIAAAFQKEIISIWGTTVPEFGMYPYFPTDTGKSTILEVKGLSCRPCSKLGYDKCPKGHFKCMQMIDEGDIIKSVVGG